MYSSLQLAKKFINYYWHAANSKGHGVHSPFVFDFITSVLNDRQVYPVYRKMETRRRELLKSKKRVTVQDFGAGSAVIKTSSRVVGSMAGSSLKPRKYARLLYRLARHYKINHIIELGTSFGVTTGYLAAAATGKVYTLEGAPAIAKIARETFSQCGLDNIELVEGEFSQTLLPLLDKVSPGMVFIDGNHRYQPTLDYFNTFISTGNTSMLLVFDDIHWSAEMEAAWEIIKVHPAVTITIDLFFIGIVSLRAESKVRQHFLIRF